MSLGTANRDGGKTSESGHLRPLSKIFGGNILGNYDTALKVSQRAAGANMSVDVGIGDAMVYRSDGTYGHPVFNDAVYNQAITTADPSNPRNDIVVIYVDYGQTPSTGVSNNTNGVVKIKVVAGTPAGSPADPTVSAIQSSVGSGNPWAYLARVRVAAGASSIGNSVIDDLRSPTQPNFFTPSFSDIINGSCRVAQRTAPNLSTSYQYGQVDRFAAKGAGTAVSAGTISQSTAANAGASGYALKLAGVTITGTGLVYVRYRMEARDARRFKNQPASFAVKVYHDVGSAINYVITVRKPTVADNFASVTDIANSGNISVPSATPTTIKFENINSSNLGDVSNGLEIEIAVSCGAVTAKNFEFAEFQLNRGIIASQFVGRSYAEDLQMCCRYYVDMYSGNADYTGRACCFVTTNGSRAIVPTPCPMRVAPTVTYSSIVVRFGGADYNVSAVPNVFLSNEGVNLYMTTTGTSNGNNGCMTGSDGALKFDAEL